MTPFMTPTNGSRRPKSVVSVTTAACDPLFPRPRGEGPRASLAVAVDDEVGDEDERLPVLRGREMLESSFALSA